jgi:hypothetical protein
MEFTRLGGRGAEVARLAIGTMTFGTQMNEESAHRLLEQLQPFLRSLETRRDPAIMSQLDAVRQTHDARWNMFG